MHIYSEEHPTVFSGVYSQESKHKIVALERTDVFLFSELICSICTSGMRMSGTDTPVRTHLQFYIGVTKQVKFLAPRLSNNNKNYVASFLVVVSI